MEKGCKSHREILNSSKGMIVSVVGKPCNIHRLQGKPYDNSRISLQSVNITKFPISLLFTETRFLKIFRYAIFYIRFKVLYCPSFL